MFEAKNGMRATTVKNILERYQLTAVRRVALKAKSPSPLAKKKHTTTNNVSE